MQISKAHVKEIKRVLKSTPLKPNNNDIPIYEDLIQIDIYGYKMRGGGALMNNLSVINNLEEKMTEMSRAVRDVSSQNSEAVVKLIKSKRDAWRKRLVATYYASVYESSEHTELEIAQALLSILLTERLWTKQISKSIDLISHCIRAITLALPWCSKKEILELLSVFKFSDRIEDYSDNLTSEMGMLLRAWDYTHVPLPLLCSFEILFDRNVAGEWLINSVNSRALCYCGPRRKNDYFWNYAILMLRACLRLELKRPLESNENKITNLISELVYLQAKEAVNDIKSAVAMRKFNPEIMGNFIDVLDNLDCFEQALDDDIAKISRRAVETQTMCGYTDEQMNNVWNALMDRFGDENSDRSRVTNADKARQHDVKLETLKKRARKQKKKRIKEIGEEAYASEKEDQTRELLVLDKSVDKELEKWDGKYEQKVQQMNACVAQCGFCERFGAKSGRKVGGQMKQCSRCKGVWYCGAKCQKKDWKLHKKSCRNKK